MWEAIKNFLNLIKGSIGELFRALLNMLRDETTQYAIKLAKKFVAEVEADPAVLYDEDKRREAFDRIKAYAEAEGIILKDRVVNLAIEIALTYFKEAGWPF